MPFTAPEPSNRRPRIVGDAVVIGKFTIIARRYVLHGIWKVEKHHPVALSRLLSMAYGKRISSGSDMVKLLEKAAVALPRNPREADQLISGLPEPLAETEERVEEANRLLKDGVSPYRLAEAMRGEKLGLNPAPAWTDHLTLCDKGIVLGKGTVIVALTDDGLDLEGKEAEVLALLSLARRRPAPAETLEKLASVSRAVMAGNISVAAITLAQLGQPPLQDEELAKSLMFAANKLKRGVKPLELLKKAGFSAATLEKAYGKSETWYKFNPNHVPAGSSEGGQFASNDSNGNGVPTKNSLLHNAAYTIPAQGTDDTPQNNSASKGIDWSVISQMEGSRNDGYIPPTTPSNDPNQQHDITPGVTIASGFDLGQYSEDDLKRMGLSDEVANKLKPYLDKQGSDAQKALQSFGVPHLTDEEIAQVNEAVHQDELDQLKTRYDKAVGADKPHFDDLLSNVQTALASVAFQYGPAFGTRSDSASGRKLWKEAVSQNWDTAEKTLRQWGANIPAYANRRNREADLINPKPQARSPSNGQNI